MKTFLLLGIVFFASATAAYADEITGPYIQVPKSGFVPDEQTAIRIAEAVWIPIYGEKQIESEKPFEAILKNGIWEVSGSLPEGWVGGTAIAEIAKTYGHILGIRHEQ